MATEGDCGGQVAIIILMIIFSSSSFPKDFRSGRLNQNRVDLNRNFPVSDVSRRTSASHDLEPESAAVVDWLTRNSFVLGANFHGGAVVASYPWDHYVVIHCTKIK